MNVSLDEYYETEYRIKCTATNDSGLQYTFFWDRKVGMIPEANVVNESARFTYRERIEAAKKAKIIYSMIYGLNQNI